MTREEAIQRLIDVRKKYSLGMNETIAIETAIKALSQEPCKDTDSIRKNVLKYRTGNFVAYNGEWLKKHWQMEMDIVCGVKPCTDAVSREAVLDIVNNPLNIRLDEIIKKLPSVTPVYGGKDNG